MEENPNNCAKWARYRSNSRNLQTFQSAWARKKPYVRFVHFKAVSCKNNVLCLQSVIVWLIDHRINVYSSAFVSYIKPQVSNSGLDLILLIFRYRCHLCVVVFCNSFIFVTFCKCPVLVDRCYREMLTKTHKQSRREITSL